MESRHRRWSRPGAALGLLVMLVGGCSVTPVREVQPAAPTATPAEPESLAFDPGDDAAAGRSTAVDPIATPIPEPTAVMLEPISPGAWVQITDDAIIGVHSAPDSIYTRMGVLEPGAGVLGTGRRVDNAGVMWMEINWGEGTAWVLAAGFAPAD